MYCLAISGSLRQASLNSAVLRAITAMAPVGVRVECDNSLGDLPLFNPDIEDTDPAPVRDLRTRIIAADVLLIASPEYAHGVTGVLKNALDWMVGNESFVDKPIALINTSPRATHAQAALREILTTMSARVIDKACLTVPVLGSGLSASQIMQRTETQRAVLDIFEVLTAAVRLGRLSAQ